MKYLYHDEEYVGVDDDQHGVHLQRGDEQIFVEWADPDLIVDPTDRQMANAGLIPDFEETEEEREAAFEQYIDDVDTMLSIMRPGVEVDYELEELAALQQNGHPPEEAAFHIALKRFIEEEKP
jgi:hypothetical protein